MMFFGAYKSAMSMLVLTTSKVNSLQSGSYFSEGLVEKSWAL